MINVTVWNEYRHEKNEEKIADIYPKGIHNAIAEFLNEVPGLCAQTATLDEEKHGLTDEVLDNTDVLIWWGHIAHEEVEASIVEKIYRRCMRGMGLIALHSAHLSRIFVKLMGTTCNLRWREADENMRLWTIEPSHPIAGGIPEFIDLEHEEMYGERFDIPAPDSIVFLGWFKGGEVFRSGCCFSRGAGKIFYFQPGHESYPVYYNKIIQRILINAVKWAKSDIYSGNDNCIHVSEPLEKL